MRKNSYIKILIALMVALIIALLLFKARAMGVLSLDGSKAYIKSYGKFAAIVFIFLFILRTLFIFFPYSIMILLGGSIFGNLYGFLISLVCVFFSATLAFYISRMAGQDVLNKLLKGKMKNMHVKIEEHGFKIVFLMRVSCLFPFDALSYAAGLTKVKYKGFIIGTLLGIIPETFSLNMLGNNIKDPFSWNFVVSIGLVIVTVAIPYILKKKKASNRNSEDIKL